MYLYYSRERLSYNRRESESGRRLESNRKTIYGVFFGIFIFLWKQSPKIHSYPKISYWYWLPTDPPIIHHFSPNQTTLKKQRQEHNNSPNQ